eukprot:12398640-Karenia_brevis.AAC.1
MERSVQQVYGASTRRTRKASGEAGVDSHEHISSHKKYKRTRSFRSRRFVIGSGAQCMSQRVQRAALEDTDDCDIKNAMFSLLPQTIQRLELQQTSVWANELEVLRRLREERSAICRNDLGCAEAVGKKILQKVAIGGSIPEDMRDNVFLKALARTSIWLRWLAVTVRQDAWKELKGDPECKWPEASCLSHLYFAVEDYIMDV